VWYQEKYPNLLFACDGEIFTLAGKQCLVLGGAYSVDKYYRLQCGYAWFDDEQPDDAIKLLAEAKITNANNKVDIVFSHTCPFKYIPTEMFLAGLDQSTVDNSTELWLDEIESRLDYKAWYCGHYHTNKHIDKMHFLFENWEFLEDLR
jgi:3-oxoacid CoA-transferase subunit A